MESRVGGKREGRREGAVLGNTARSLKLRRSRAPSLRNYGPAGGHGHARHADPL